MQNENNKTLVSIITVSYNSVLTIERTIKSIISQTYSNIEYIIIDGGSTDGTIDIINKYKQNIAYCISEKDDGIYDAMNKGLKIASGDIIGILNSDDLYHDKSIINIVVEEYLKSDKMTVLHGDIDYIYKTGMIRHMRPDLNVSNIIKSMIFKHPTMFVPRGVYNSIGYFNLEYRLSADYDFLIRLVNRNVNFNYINKTITDMYDGGASIESEYNGIIESYNAAIANGFNKNRVRFYYAIRFLKNQMTQIITKMTGKRPYEIIFAIKSYL